MAEAPSLENEISSTCSILTGDSSASMSNDDGHAMARAMGDEISVVDSKQNCVTTTKNGMVDLFENESKGAVTMGDAMSDNQAGSVHTTGVNSCDHHVKQLHTVKASLSHQETCRKSDLEMEGVDSGVHSGTENGSDGKSSSSSPGLSAESSVHDLSDKLLLDKRLSNEQESSQSHIREGSVDNDPDKCIDQLADDISKSVTLSPPIDRDIDNGIEYVVYESELQMTDIMRLITKDLSEPYSIYTYRYFIHNWPKLCFLAMHDNECVGAIVCKLDMHKKMVRRGYIAMLAVDQNCRRKGIGSHLVLKAIGAMINDDCDEVVLETEITNRAALRLYENLGFVRDKRLFRYYLNGVDALRLKLWLR